MSFPNAQQKGSRFTGWGAGGRELTRNPCAEFAEWSESGRKADAIVRECRAPAERPEGHRHRNCRRFWTLVSLRVTSVNSHGNVGPGARHMTVVAFGPWCPRRRVSQDVTSVKSHMDPGRSVSTVDSVETCSRGWSPGRRSPEKVVKKGHERGPEFMS